MTTVAYDCYLGDKSNPYGYRLGALVKDSAPQIAPRFSSGASGQTDLDLLKSAGVTDFSGGMFQRDHEDPTKVARAMGIFNYADKKVYPTVPRSTFTSVPSDHAPTAKAESDSYAFISYGMFAAGTYYNILYQVTLSGGYVSITLPAALISNGFTTITGMAIHKSYLFVGSQSSTGNANCYRYNINTGTWQDITGNLNRFFTLRGALYGVSVTGHVWSVTNEEAAGAATYTQISIAGSNTISGSVPTCALEFNGAGWISKSDGLYRFDGVTAIRVLQHNITQMCVFNGAVYFVSGSWLYRFDGTNLERLQFFSTQERSASSTYASLGLSANADYLYFSTVVITSDWTQGDKTAPSATGLHRIYTFDGSSFSLLHESNETVGALYSATLLLNQNKLYDIFANYSGSALITNYYTFTLTDILLSSAVTSSSKMEFTTSEFDDGFPNIYKSLELIDINYNDMIVGDSILVKYQLYDGKVWGSWITAGTITSTTDNKLEVTNFTNKLFKRMRINATVTLAASSTFKFKNLTWRYTLQPRVRWRWQATFMAMGNGRVKDRTGAPITTQANAVMNQLTSAVKQKTPLFFFTPDYGVVKTTVNSAALSVEVKGQLPVYTDLYLEYPLVAIKNASNVWEILQVTAAVYDGSTKTTLTLNARGYLSITAAQLTAGAEVRICHKVYVNRLIRDSMILKESSYQEQATTGESQLEHEPVFEIVEV